MLVVMKAQASEEQVRAVCQKIEALGYRAHSMPGAQRTAIGITGNKGEVDSGSLEEMAGVQEVIRVSKPYKLVSRDTKPDNTVIKFAAANANAQPVSIGGPTSPSSPARAASKAANRPSPQPSASPAPEPSSSAAAPTSLALLRILFRDSARKV